MRLSRFFLPLFALLCAAFTPRVSAADNILLIIADDLGADSFPLTAGAGASLPPMPNVTALKNRGVLFTNARAHPTCSPSRASMLTGRHPFRTGIGTALTDATSPQLQASEFTLPEAFAANPSKGYTLRMFGKWHLNSGAGTNDTPRSIGGWPSFAGSITGALPDYFSWTKVLNGVASTSTNYATTDTASDVVSFIDAQAGPWLAWVAFNAPHAPFQLPPSNLHSYGTVTANRALYEAMCEALDTEIGHILAHVDLTKTNVIFLGDNGTPPNVIQPPYSSAHAKETLYDGGTRVPLIIAGPAVAAQNRTSTAPVHCVDLYATILELAGINVKTTQPAANPLDSKSLLPILQNTTDTARYAFTQQFGSGIASGVSGRAVTDAAGYKLVQFDDGREEFYKVGTDTNEGTSLLGATISAADQAAFVALKLQLATYTAAGTQNDALLTSWFTDRSTRYARLYATKDDLTNHQTSATWSRGSGVQSNPVYAGVQQIDYSASWVYVHTTGLPSHIMGPWYNDVAKQNLFPNYPSNTAATFRFPRTPVIPTTKTLFGGGNIGYFVDGVSMFDIRDAFYWNGTADASGTGNFNRDAYINEGVTFDNAGAHQAGNNHHYHANPIGLRYLLGDHVVFNATTNVYTEATGPAAHSPILGWVKDGLPLYGPYGYSQPLNAASAVTRMRSGFQPRTGAANVIRHTLPEWAARAYGRSATLLSTEYGPDISAGFPLGRYLEDNDYRGDLGQVLGTDFDLNEYNVRYCVTPEFPGGIWAYFLCITAAGVPQFPYQVGRAYYGDPAGGAVTSIAEGVNTPFAGGPFASDSAGGIVVAGNDAAVTWNAVEGGIYRVDASADLATWNPLVAALTVSGGDLSTFTEVGARTGNAKRFYRAARTGLATYDRTGGIGTTFTTVGGGPNTVTPATGARGAAVSVVIQLDTASNPPLPAAGAAVQSVTAGAGITVSAVTRPSQTLVTATFTIAAGAAVGARNVTVTFVGPGGNFPARTLTGGFTVQ